MSRDQEYPALMNRFARCALLGCMLTFIAAAPALADDDRMAGPIPVSKPKPHDDTPAAPVPPRGNDERMAGTKKKSDAPEWKKSEPVKPAAEKKKPAAKESASKKTDEETPAAKIEPAAASTHLPAQSVVAAPKPRTGNTMNRKAMESLGPLTNPLYGSLGNDMWDGSSRATLIKYIPLLPTGDAGRPAQLLTRRVLLSNGDVKMLGSDSTPSGSPDIFTLRLEKLLEMGAYDDAVDLYTLIEGEPSHDRLGRAGIMALMYGGFPAQACLEARAVHHDFSGDNSGDDHFWTQIESICTFIQVQSAKAIQSSGIHAASVKTKTFDRAAITGVPGSRILTMLASRPSYRHSIGNPKDIEELSEIERAVIKGLGRFDYSRLKVKKLQDISTPALMLMATDRNVAAPLRATLNLEAARRGIIDSARLGEIYLDLAGKEDRFGAEPASLTLWDRYALYAKSTDTAERSRMAATLLEASQGLPVALLPFADSAPDINPATLSANGVRNGMRLMLYSNTVPPERWVTAWLKNESADSVKNRDSVALYLANILLENLPTNSAAFPEDAVKPLFQGPESPKSAEIWSVFSGLGRENVLHNVAGQDVYEKHVDLTLVNDYVMPTVGLLEQIREASNNDRLGEVALLAAVALNEYSPGKTHPGVFREVLQSLITVGLKEEAQQVALGVVLSLEQKEGE